MIRRPHPYEPFESENWQGFFRELQAFLTLSTTATLDFGSIAAGAVGTLNVTLRGATVGSVVLLGPPAAIAAGLTWSGYISAADTVTIRLNNGTAGAIDPASASWRVAVLRY